VYLKALTFTCFILFSTSAIAQTQTNEIELLQLESQTINKKIEDSEEIVLQLNDALNKTQADLLKKEKELANQKILLDKAPTPAHQRAYNLIQNAVLMSEHSISTQERRILRQVNKLKESRVQLDLISLAITEKEAQQAIANRPPSPPPTPTALPAKPKVQVAEAFPSPTLPATSTKDEVVKSNENTDSSPVKDSLAIKSNKEPKFSQEELEKAQEIMDRLASRLSRSPGHPLFRNLTVKSENLTPKKMAFLGANQYRADLTLSAGKTTFVINGKNYKYTVDDNRSDKAHILIFDSKRADRPRLSIIPQDILSLLDAPPIE